MNWYYRLDEQEVGPLSAAALQDLHGCGAVPGETLVRAEGSDLWLTCAEALGQQTGLEAPVPQPVHVISSPSRDAPVSENPSRTPANNPHPTERRNKHSQKARRKLLIFSTLGIAAAAMVIGGIQLGNRTKNLVSPDGRSQVGSDSQSPAGRDDAVKQFQMGLRYFEGEKFSGEAALKTDVEVKNPELAFKHFTNAAKQELPDAQYYLAVCYGAGFGVTKDLEESTRWLKKAADQGFAKAQYLLGVAYTTGEGVTKDDQTGFSWINQASDQGYPDAQCFMGRRYLLGKGVELNERKGIELLRKAAEKDCADACYALGSCYEEGLGTANDPEQASEWYAKAYLKSVHFGRNDDTALAARHPLRESAPDKQVDYGIDYLSGEGVVKSELNAVWLFRKAAAQDNPRGQFLLGQCYALGSGVAKDGNIAVDWYRKSAALGYAPAHYALGLCYTIGTGVEKDDKIAVDWYRKAAVLGDAPAQLSLAHCHRDGKGVGKNNLTAYMWFLIAGPEPMAQYDLGIMKELATSSLTKDEIAAATRMADLWKRDKSVRASLANGVPLEPGKSPDSAPKSADQTDAALPALSVFKNGTLDEARECVHLLDAELIKDPGNQRIKRLKTTITDIFRDEANLSRALAGRHEADRQYQVEMRNLEIASKPSALTGRIDTNEVDRIRREAAQIKPKAEAAIESCKAKLLASLTRGISEIQSPEREILAPKWQIIGARNGIKLPAPDEVDMERSDLSATKSSGKLPVVKILSAVYGTGGKNADVTRRVRQLVEVERRSFSSNPRDLKADPNPGWNKGLTIEYTVNGARRKQHRNENETILIDSFYK